MAAADEQKGICGQIACSMGAFLCLLEQAEEMEAIVPNGGSSMDRISGEGRAIQVSVVTIVGNVVLTILKLAAGIVAHSGAMVSDAVHSASTC